MTHTLETELLSLTLLRGISEANEWYEGIGSPENNNIKVSAVFEDLYDNYLLSEATRVTFSGCKTNIIFTLTYSQALLGLVV